MKCLLVLLIVAVAAGRLASAASTCALSEHFFARHNISADNGDAPGPICGGQCCGRAREEQLQGGLARRLAAALDLPPIADLLLDTRSSLIDHLDALSRQSQNQTAAMFAKVYREHAARAQAPLAALFDDARAFLRPPGAELAGELDPPPPPPRDMLASATALFRDIFPVAYHQVLELEQKQEKFTPEYEACLRDAFVNVKPFGDIPNQVGTSLSRSLGGALALLHALRAGAGVLAAGGRLLARSEPCAAALLRAVDCARCRGHDARPCRNYCLNVSRGCVGAVLSELDAPWAGYVDAVERVARLDADATLRGLHSRLSEAIMRPLENRSILEQKVRQECGPTSTTRAESRAPLPATRRDPVRAPPPDTELLQFAASLADTKHLFAAPLADRLCEDPDFAADGNDRCWTGESIGQYTKPLVSSSSVSDQRYNPEVTAGASHDHDAASLADRLRSVRQSLVSSSVGGAGGGAAADVFMQSDEAGAYEGSGSGRIDDDDTYDGDGSGDGSGDGDSNTDPRILQPEGTPPPSTQSAFVSRPASLGTVAAMVLALRYCIA